MINEDFHVLSWLRQAHEKYADLPDGKLLVALGYKEHSSDDVVRQATSMEDIHIRCVMCGCHFSDRLYWYMKEDGSRNDMCRTCAREMEDGIVSGSILYDIPEEQSTLLDDPEFRRHSRKAVQQLRSRYARLLDWECYDDFPDPK